MSEDPDAASPVASLTRGLGICGAVAVIVALAVHARVWIVVVAAAAPFVILTIAIVVARMLERRRQ